MTFFFIATQAVLEILSFQHSLFLTDASSQWNSDNLTWTWNVSDPVVSTVVSV